MRCLQIATSVVGCRTGCRGSGAVVIPVVSSFARQRVRIAQDQSSISSAAIQSGRLVPTCQFQLGVQMVIKIRLCA